MGQGTGLFVSTTVSLRRGAPLTLAVPELRGLPGGRPRGRAFHFHVAALPQAPQQAGQVPDGGVGVLTAQGGHAGPQPLFRDGP